MNASYNQKFTLTESWILTFSSDDHHFSRFDDLKASSLTLYAASVPGNVELDLERAGIIDDPYHGLNALKLREWEDRHFWYALKFNVSIPDKMDSFLHFEGIDCYADIFLNGRKIGSTDNALVGHEFSVTGDLIEGENELVIHIQPPFAKARQFEYPPLLGAARLNVDSLYVRKAPHCFGWDIMPRILSAGLWRPVSLIFRPVERIEDVFMRTPGADRRMASLWLHYKVRTESRSAKYELEVEGSHGESRFSCREPVLFEAGRIDIKVMSPDLWWPRGRGGQALYTIVVKLIRNGEVVDCVSWKHGIRTIELDRTSTTDSGGSGKFCFIVNGEPLYVLGTNWVPADAFHSRDAERIPRLLELAEEIGCNTIRCWGGNVYESDLFFDLCDEKGFLVWQDFAFACAIYPQDDGFQKRVAEEARQVVRRLRRHACLGLWCGDNECDQAYFWYNGGDPNQNILTRRVLPEVVRCEDPGRHYLASSPFISEDAYNKGDQVLPEHHLWGARDGFKSAYYKEATCHFVSEIGYHGCPSPDSIRRFISESQLWPPGNAEWLLHGTSPVQEVSIYDYRIELMQKQIAEYFAKEAETLEEFSELSQFVQAEALKFFIELFRTGKWHRTGIIWWNLADGWPQFSDAVVDYYFEKKLAFDYIRLSQQPVCLAFKESRDWKHDLVACNDTRDELKIQYRVWNVETKEELCSGSASISPDAVTYLASIPASAAKTEFLVIQWDSRDSAGLNHYLTGQPPYNPDQYRSWFEQYRKVFPGVVQC